MSKCKNIIAIALIILPLILCACDHSSTLQKDGLLTVEDSINVLMTTENYSSLWAKYTSNEYIGESEEIISSKVFHDPYKLKSEFTSFTPANKELIAIEKYQLSVNGDLKDKFIYYSQDGSVNYKENDIVISYEWFLLEVKNSLISAEYISEETDGEVKLDKYEITVAPYPFMVFYNFPFDKSNELTSIFFEEYQDCFGYAYIDTSTNCISKLEFDLTDKSELSDKINLRIEEETDEAWWFIMPKFDKMNISISFYDINDESAECAEIEKEINEIMK